MRSRTIRQIEGMKSQRTAVPQSPPVRKQVNPNTDSSADFFSPGVRRGDPWVGPCWAELLPDVRGVYVRCTHGIRWGLPRGRFR